MSQSRQRLYYWHESDPSKPQWEAPSWDTTVARVYSQHLKASEDLYLYRSCMNFCKSAYLELWLKKLVNCSTSSLLDVACGKGGDVQKVQDFALYYGLDVSPLSIQEAQKRYPGKSFHIASFNKPLNVKNFDVAICMLALHYAEDLKKSMSYISDAVKSGGYFLCMVLDSDVLLKHPRGIEPMQVHEWETIKDKHRLWISLEGTMTTLPEWLYDENTLKQAGEQVGLRLLKSCNALHGLASEFGWKEWVEPADARFALREALHNLHKQHYKSVVYDTKHWDFVSQYKLYLFQKH